MSVLIKTNFTRLSLEDKVNIPKLGQPLPGLNLTQSVKGKIKIGHLCDVSQEIFINKITRCMGVKV